MRHSLGIALSSTQFAGAGSVNPPAEQSSRHSAVAAEERALTLRRFAPLATIVVLAAIIFAMGWHRELTLETLVKHRATIAAFVEAHSVAAIGLFIALYIVVVALSLPGATILTIGGGVLFGAIVGGIAAVVGATIGATIVFLIARSAAGDLLLRNAGRRLAALGEGFRKDAFNYLLFLRLVPLFPFFLVNLAPAIFGVRLAPFIAATAIGIVPATFVYALAGAELDGAIAPQVEAYRACLAAARAACTLDFNIHDAVNAKLIVALVGLGLVALIPVIVKRRRAKQLRR